MLAPSFLDGFDHFPVTLELSGPPVAGKGPTITYCARMAVGMQLVSHTRGVSLSAEGD
jgi:hypothetical protein